jgi:phosphoglucomutase
VIGGEESNGLTVHGHIPEKDGIIACLLVVEMVAKSKKTIRELLKELEEKTGPFINDRKNFRLTNEKMQAIIEKLKKGSNEKFGSFDVLELITVDGYKFMLGRDTWAMIRLSGTEPIVRLYAEAKEKKVLNKILEEGEKFIKS